jgi:hypothetical protein
MISQATKRNTIKATILASLVILAATINLVGFKRIDIDIEDFIEGFVVGICLMFIVIWVIALITTAVKKEKNEDAEFKDLALNKVYLSIGMLNYVIGIILKKISFTGDWIQFVTGIFFITSIIFTMMYLVGLRKVKIG